MSKQRRMATASSARRDWPALGKLLPAQLSYPIVLGTLLVSACCWRGLSATGRSITCCWARLCAARTLLHELRTPHSPVGGVPPRGLTPLRSRVNGSANKR